jgi:hypothetical protein
MYNSKLKQAYYSLSREDKHHTYIRNKICYECNVGTANFYCWLSGRTAVPHLAKPVIAEIMKMPVEELFPEFVEC